MKLLNKTLSAACLALLAGTATANDIRALGMGGAAVSAGQGVNGAMANPALLGTYRNSGVTSFRISMSVEARDSAEIIGNLEENEALIDDVNSAVDEVLGRTLSCDPVFAAASDVCLDNTGTLGALAADLGALLADIDREPFDFRAGGAIGFAIANSPTPFALDFSTTVTATGLAVISDSDRSYVDDISDALGDDVLTQGEILDNASISLSDSGTSVVIGLPDDILDSELEGSAVVRAQVALSLSRRVEFGDYEVNLGVTPRLSLVSVGNFGQSINEDDTSTARDNFDASENEETTFTVDIGATTLLPQNRDIRVGGVIRNLIPESIESETGFEVESTPQLIVSAMYQREHIILTADAAINEARYDNFETQPLSIGGEFSGGPLKLRLGVSNDFSDSGNSTSFALGLGIGFFDIGVRASESNLHAGMQIALNF